MPGKISHDVVISGMSKKSKNGKISLGEDSYLSMLIDGLKINKEDLFDQNYDICIKDLKDLNPKPKILEVINEEIKLKELIFTDRTNKSATMENEKEKIVTQNKKATDIGSITHRLIELFWDKL